MLLFNKCWTNYVGILLRLWKIETFKTADFNAQLVKQERRIDKVRKMERKMSKVRDMKKKSK